MSLLGRWKQALAREDVAVDLELLSIDAPAQEKALLERRAKGLPGARRWIRSEKDLDSTLTGLGLSVDASIPIHAWVDPAGQLRCVRVGAVHEQDYGAVRAILKSQ
jgi:hypothetical protein